LEIIPVIDLLNQQVVHAKRGERQHYRPIRSSLCASSAPLAVVAAMLELYPFEHLYIADLDAIQRRGHHIEIVSQIRRHHPALGIWLDAGLSSISDIHAWQTLAVDLVVGSESLTDFSDYLALKEALGPRMILSLDFDGDRFRGPAQLLHQPSVWPERVIAMTLTRVGSAEGPDMALLETIQHQQPGIKVIAAGGVRNMQDIGTLAAKGIHGALVASAIHDGSLFPMPFSNP
jgi:phosphoribosylformimino-5-aminoimidazole carboxamide ribotide isomerase